MLAGMAAEANHWRTDANLRALLRRRAPWFTPEDSERLDGFGAWVAGAVEAQANHTGRHAPPVLEVREDGGTPRTLVRHNPLYAAAHREVYERGIVGLNHGNARRPFALTFVMGYLLSQSDISIHCPATLTGAVAYVLDRFAPEPLRHAFLPALTRMDGTAATGGTWVTEKQGGSDVGATETVARHTSEGMALTGLKWFASNAGGGLALATARPEGAGAGTEGLGLYLVPGRRPDGTPNALHIRRLKEKLGTRGLATGEIELAGAHAVEVAPPPEGFKLMMAALGYSRIHNAMAAAGVQRRAFAEALGHAEARHAFGSPLAAYPMVQEQLVAMQVRAEAGLALAFEAAQAFDAAHGEGGAGALRDPWLRVATALAKYLTAEWAVADASQAIELLGGNGYTEEYPTARLLRDAQVLTVWEGPPNIQALELLRLVSGRLPGLAAFDARLDSIAGAAQDVNSAAFTEPLARIAEARRETAALAALIAGDAAEGPRRARRLMARMARVLAAGLLVEEATADLAAGDGRKALVARLYAARELGTATAPAAGASDAERFFAPLTSCGAVEPPLVRESAPA